MNYVSYARTNYFRVLDIDKLTAAAALLGASLHENEGKYALMSDTGEGFNAFGEDDEEIDLVQELRMLLPEGEVVVVHAIGREGMRYLTGDAYAFDHTGKMECLCLDNIYARAARKFKVPVTSITQVRY